MNHSVWHRFLHQDVSADGSRVGLDYSKRRTFTNGQCDPTMKNNETVSLGGGTSHAACCSCGPLGT